MNELNEGDFISSIRKKYSDNEKDIPIKTVVYVPNRSKMHGRFPVVSVHKRGDGRYVVVEQRPVHTQFSHENPDYIKFQQKLKNSMGNDPLIKFRSVKPAWKWASQGNYIERSFNRSYHEPYLPPMKNNWKAESKVGSLDYTDHIPGGGDKKIPSFPVKWDAKAKVGSFDNFNYPFKSRSYPPSEGSDGSGNQKWLRPRYGASAFNGAKTVHFTPGDVIEEHQKKVNKAKSKVGSLDNINFQSFGGNVEIPRFPVNWKAEAKIESLEKIFHEPGGGNVDIINLKPKWKGQSKIGSLENADHTPRPSRFKVPHFSTDWKSGAKIGSLDNVEHTPRGGDNKIFNDRLNWRRESKISHIWKNKPSNIDPYDPEYDEDAEIEARIREMFAHLNKSSS